MIERGTIPVHPMSTCSPETVARIEALEVDLAATKKVVEFLRGALVHTNTALVEVLKDKTKKKPIHPIGRAILGPNGTIIPIPNRPEGE